MKRPCDHVITCPGINAPEPDWPVINISAEAPDPLLFTAIVWPEIDPYNPPCLFNCVPEEPNDPLTCFDVIQSAESQEMADLLAQAAGLTCPKGQINLTNDAQSATVACANGTTFSYTVPAGTIWSGPIPDALIPIWINWANAWAQAEAYKQASALRSCIEPTVTTDPNKNIKRTGGGPSLLDNPGWMCLGETILPDEGFYEITGPGASAYTITAAGIPPGTAFTQTGPKTAQLSGTPTQSGSFIYTITATSTTLPAITLTVFDQLDVITIDNPKRLPLAEVPLDYSEQLTASGGVAPYTFYADPVLMPDWLSVSSSGLITGIPDSLDAGITFEFEVHVTDALNRSCAKDFEVHVKPCFLNAPGPGTECTPYSFQMLAAPSGVTYSGSLPARLSINASGLITGTPTEHGTLTFPITITDSEGASATENFSVAIAAVGGPDTTAKSIADIGAWAKITALYTGTTENGSGSDGTVDTVLTAVVGAAGDPQSTYTSHLTRCGTIPDYPITVVYSATLTPNDGTATLEILIDVCGKNVFSNYGTGGTHFSIGPTVAVVTAPPTVVNTFGGPDQMRVIARLSQGTSFSTLHVHVVYTPPVPP